MKKTFVLLVAAVSLVAGNAFGAFVAPTPEQIAAAANDPSLLTALLKDATPAQAAQIVKDIVVKVSEAKLSKKEEKKRVATLVKLAFAAFPADKANELAAELGKQMALIPKDSPGHRVVSIVQQTIRRHAGTSSGASFGKAFNPDIPPPPPITKGYEAQS